MMNNKQIRKVGRSESLNIMISELAAEGCYEINRILPDWDSKETFVEYSVK